MDATPKLNKFHKTNRLEPAFPVSAQTNLPEQPKNRLSSLIQLLSHEEILLSAIQNTSNRLEADNFNKRLNEYSAVQKYKLRFYYYLSYCDEHSLVNTLPQLSWLAFEISKLYLK